jgi:hypothetical protein
MRLRWFSLAVASAIAASTAAAAADRLFAGGGWAALRFGARCEAVARPQPPASNREKQARAGFAFEQGARRNGEFFARLSRTPRPGSSAILTIGSQPFLLAGRGPWVWSRGAQQDAAIIAAARGATSMRLEGRDLSGRRFTDRYPLDGAPTAIDAAAAGCATHARSGKI